MRFLDLCEKEVVSVEEGRFIGHVRDLEFDPVCGKICAIIVPGPGKYMGIFCRDYEYCIPWVKIVKIGPDIILVNICESDMRRKLLWFYKYKKIIKKSKSVQNILTTKISIYILKYV